MYATTVESNAQGVVCSLHIVRERISKKRNQIPIRLKGWFSVNGKATKIKFEHIFWTNTIVLAGGGRVTVRDLLEDPDLIEWRVAKVEFAVEGVKRMLSVPDSCELYLEGLHLSKQKGTDLPYLDRQGVMVWHANNARVVGIDPS